MNAHATPALPLFLNSTQVAQMIGYRAASAFLHNRERLERDTMFPQPLPTTTHRAFRWRRDEVQAWLDRQGLPRAPVGSANVHLLRLAARH